MAPGSSGGFRTLDLGNYEPSVLALFYLETNNLCSTKVTFLSLTKKIFKITKNSEEKLPLMIVWFGTIFFYLKF
jgi:hypothetical protein